jgi:hypothetical protein
MILSKQVLRQFAEPKIIIPMDVYLKLGEIELDKRMRFIEQYVKVVSDNRQCQLNLKWD